MFCNAGNPFRERVTGIDERGGKQRDGVVVRHQRIHDTSLDGVGRPQIPPLALAADEVGRPHRDRHPQFVRALGRRKRNGILTDVDADIVESLDFPDLFIIVGRRRNTVVVSRFHDAIHSFADGAQFQATPFFDHRFCLLDGLDTAFLCHLTTRVDAVVCHQVVRTFDRIGYLRTQLR